MANTTNLNLVKPAGTDHALVSDINGNMDLIDAFAGSTNTAIADIHGCTNIGSMASQSALETALNNALSGMDVNSNKAIQIACSSTFAPFLGTVTYNAILSKGGASNNYATAIFQSINGTTNAIIKATKNTTWRFEELALKSDVDTKATKSELMYISGSGTLAITPNATLSIILGQYSAKNFMYTVFKASATNATAAAIKTHSEVTVSSSNGVLTFSNSGSDTYRVQMISL